MGGRGEPVLLRAPLHPRLEIAVGELDDAVAARADEMVVMHVAAEPVAELARVVGEGVDGALLVEERQRAVHGCQPDAGALSSQPVVELAGRDVVVLAGQLLHDLQALRGLPDPVTGEERSRSTHRAHVV
jgi:hypothetical protein